MARFPAQPGIAAITRTHLRLLVRGAGQGVGFRPFVCQPARALGLAGGVGDSPQGVTVEVEGASGRTACLAGTAHARAVTDAVDLHAGQPRLVVRDLHSDCASSRAAEAPGLPVIHQNVRLTEAAVAALRAAGYEPVWHQRVPPNDGGIARGQAVWAAWAEQRGEARCV